MNEPIKFEIKTSKLVPKYPKLLFSFEGTGGNIQVCLAKFASVLIAGDIPQQVRTKILTEASSLDKEKLFRVIEETVVVTD